MLYFDEQRGSGAVMLVWSFLKLRRGLSYLILATEMGVAVLFSCCCIVFLFHPVVFESEVKTTGTIAITSLAWSAYVADWTCKKKKSRLIRPSQHSELMAKSVLEVPIKINLFWKVVCSRYVLNAVLIESPFFTMRDYLRIQINRLLSMYWPTKDFDSCYNYCWLY